MSTSRLGKITRALDVGARRQLRAAGCNPDTLTLVVTDRHDGVVRVHGSFDLPAAKADYLAELVDRNEPDVVDGDHF